jgi:hypothetical protein
MQNALVCFDNEPLLVEPGLVTDELFELFLGLAIQLVFLILEVIFNGSNIDSLLHLEVELLLSQLSEVAFDCLYRFLRLILLLDFPILLVVVREVPSVENIVFH